MFTLKIDNFRNLKNVNWEIPEGQVSLLVGRNNSGKTNLLKSLLLLQRIRFGGNVNVLREYKYKKEISSLTVSKDEENWEVSILRDETNFYLKDRETAKIDGSIESVEKCEKIGKALENFTYIDDLTAYSRDLEIDLTYWNLVKCLQERFPDVHDLSKASRSEIRFLGIILTISISPSIGHSTFIIENVEQDLDPEMIRKLIKNLKKESNHSGHTFILTTRSPIVLNEFKNEPDQVFIMCRKDDRFPTKLTDLHDPDWLAHFSLGDLYDRGEFSE